MSVLDLFSAGPGIRTNNQAAKILGKNQTRGFDYGVGQLQGGANLGIGTLQDYSGQAQDALKSGTAEQIAAYQQGIDPWKSLFNQFQPAAETYWGALGVGDPEDVAAARGRFQASPGYDYTLGQGLEGLSRVAQSTGQLGAGNEDAMKYAHNLSNMDYHQWITDLLPSIEGEQRAAGGIQSGENLIGGAYGDQGKGIAELLAKTGGSIADIQGGLGKDLASLGETYYGNKGQIGANRLQANQSARTAADQNSLSALFGIANLGVNAFTGGLGSGFGNLFGGNSALTNAGYTQTSPNNWMGPTFGGYGDVNL